MDTRNRRLMELAYKSGWKEAVLEKAGRGENGRDQREEICEQGGRLRPLAYIEAR